MSGPLVVFVDACVLYNAMLRDVLLRVAERDLVRLRWSTEILRETSEALSRSRNIPDHKLARLGQLMNEAFPDALVMAPTVSIPNLPDPGDAHVIAAASACDADLVLTLNIRHFPSASLEALNLYVMTPDALLCATFNADPEGVIKAVTTAAECKRRPPMSARDVLESLRNVTPEFAERALAELSRS